MGIRDVLIFGLVFAALPVALLHPWVGVVLWAWFGLMNPHRLAYGAATDFPFAMVIAVVTVIGFVITRDERRFKATPAIVMLYIFTLWMCITTTIAMNPAGAEEMWVRTMKVIVMALVAPIVIHTKKHVEILVIAIVFSLGYYGVKGGLFTLLSGGTYRVWGPASSFIEDNNALALALTMTVPLMYYLYEQATRKGARVGLMICIGLMCASILGSHSRGALLAISAMAIFMWIKSRRKTMLAMALIVVAPTLFFFMPDNWHERMQTISEYKEDGSAQGRIKAWITATNVANDRIMGGGFSIAGSPEVVQRYAPAEGGVLLAAHSIYFQVLGEHGYIGLFMYMLMWFFTWRSATQTIRQARERPELAWAVSLSRAIQVSIISYMVGGAFLNLAYWDLPYYQIVIVAIVRDIVRRSIASTANESTAGRMPALGTA
jgi:putative inorganic carbon (hco3(-)) transporter